MTEKDDRSQGACELLRYCVQFCIPVLQARGQVIGGKTDPGSMRPCTSHEEAALGWKELWRAWSTHTPDSTRGLTPRGTFTHNILHSPLSVSGCRVTPWNVLPISSAIEGPSEGGQAQASLLPTDAQQAVEAEQAPWPSNPGPIPVWTLHRHSYHVVMILQAVSLQF